MSLKTTFHDFSHTIARIASGKKILEEYIKPLLSRSDCYYKISSFFTPSIIHSILLELDTCFRKKEQVKLIIGIHDSNKLIPVLDTIQNPNKNIKFQKAVEGIIQKGVEECLSVVENPRDFLFVFSELVSQNLIQIKIASVKKDYIEYLATGNWPEDDSTFHPKVSIFKDSRDTVVMNGSINSTNKGFGENIEDASFTGSWFSPNSVATYEQNFEEIWNGIHEDSQTFEFNESIRQIIDSVVQNSQFLKSVIPSAENFSYENLRRLITESPLFYHYSFKNVRLLPHQYAVYNTMLSRWPIIGLIADEVGLGKTIEAGAIIKYLKKFFTIKRVALLVPSSLRNQWQTEMFNLFGLKFYIYDSANKSLVFGPNNEIQDRISNVNRGEYFTHGISNIIFSWHYVRLSDSDGFKLTEEDKIDLVVVDEAHGARLSGDDSRDLDSTQLYRFLEQLLPSIPHKLLLTATPFQTNQLDYLALIRLLMGNNLLEENSLIRISQLNSGKKLLTQQKLDAMLELTSTINYSIKDFPENIDLSDPLRLCSLYSDERYIDAHPTTIYTLRNTRDQLKSIGYAFPNVHIDSHPIDLNKKQLQIFELSTDYIERQLFSLEAVLGQKGLGFVKTIYHQRIVSSFNACYDTLTSLREKLQSAINDGIVPEEILTLNDDDEINGSFLVSQNYSLSESELSIAQTECAFIDEILSKIKRRLLDDSDSFDPKIEKALFLTKHHINNGDKVIIFSRFTSTTNFIVNEFVKLNLFPIGRYQGDVKQFIKNHKYIDVDRETISKMFTEGHFPVIICSDAASEGLNLQTANVIINIDVPWNPARLLQRFGRIDRFGQKKEEIYFYNLFYPGTIEDKMYSRLHNRNIEFRELLGATPEITSEAHLRDLRSREFSEPSNPQSFSYKNSLLAMSIEDNRRIHEEILSRIDSLEGIFRDDTTINYFGHLFHYSTNEMDSNYIDLNHRFFNFLHVKEMILPTKLLELRNSQNDLIFYCISNDNAIYPLMSITEILDYLLCRKPITRSLDNIYFSESHLREDLELFLSNKEHKFINHNSIHFNRLENNLYQGLTMFETDIKIDCNFS